jgi:molecular chaperone DnaJ
MNKDYYGILKISKEADPAKIKGAYRKAAKRYHPDISPENEEKFKEIQEAYETLSDPEKKASYDRQLQQESRPGRGSYRLFYPEEGSFGLLDEIDRLFASLGHAMTDDFSEMHENRENLSVEILLTPKEAKKGCKIPLKMPVWIDCSRCGGTGRVGGLICGLCLGRGEEKREKRIKITIPAGATDGTEMRIPISPRDSGAKHILVTIRVSETE